MKKSWFKRAMVIALALVLVVTSLPEGTHAKTKLSITATTQEELDAALIAKNVSSILIKTDETADLKVNKGSYSKVVLTIEAPKATISNYGQFKKIIINKAKKFYERATGNSIYVNDDK